jgi:hypothetical protein
MFYGLLNLPVLVAKFKPLYRVDKEPDKDLEARIEKDLRSRAIALVCEGWCRTFGRHYATI